MNAPRPRPALTAALAACAAALLVGCGPPDFVPRSWDELSGEELALAAASPTAVVEANEVDAVASRQLDALLDLVDGFAVTQALIDALEGADAEGSGAGIRTQRVNLEGTSVRIEAGCPGQAGAGNWDGTRSNGLLRLDSPALTSEVIESISFEGQFLVEFRPNERSPEGCKVGVAALDGFARGNYEVDTDRTVLVFDDVTVIDLAEDVTTVSDDVVIFDEQGTRVVAVQDDGTFWVALFPAGITVGADYFLQAQNATYACVLLDATGTSDCTEV